MNISSIKNYVSSFTNKVIKVKSHIGRGQIEEYEGVIEGLYNGIFIIRSFKDNRIKAYSYADIITHNLVIK